MFNEFRKLIITEMSESIDIRQLNARIEQQSSFVTNLVTGMNQVIVGQKHLVESLLISLLSDGHILLEGVRGLAKTSAVFSLLPTSCQPTLLVHWSTRRRTSLSM